MDLEGVVLEAALNDLISNDLFGCSKARANWVITIEISKIDITVNLVLDNYFDIKFSL